MPERYSRTQILLHWAVFALITVQFLAHDGMEDAWRAYVRSGSAEAGSGAWLHIIAGILVLAFALWRIAIRLTRGAPRPPEGHPLMTKAAAAAHWALYGLMLLVPLSGMAGWFLGARAAAEAHEVLKTLLLIVIVLHVGAALVHQFLLRDNLIARMVPRR